MRTKNIAGIIVGLKGISDLSNEVANQLNFEKKTYNKIDLLLDFDKLDKGLYYPSIYSAKSVMNFNKNQFFVGYLPDIDYIVSDLFNDNQKTVVINVIQKNKASLKESVKKHILGRRKSDTLLSYGLFWYVFQIILLKKSKSFIHGACLHNKINKKTILIAGTGGCGKTSTSLELLDNDNISYISEDYSITSSTGELYFNPKPVSIYCSDIEFGSNVLSKLISSFGLSMRIRTFILRKVLGRNPMFKVPPESLFDNCIDTYHKCTTVVYVIRTSEAVPEVKNCSLDEFVSRCVSASIRELKTYTELSNLILSNDHINTGTYSYDNLKSKMENVFKSAFKDKNFKLVYLPIEIKPEETVKFFVKNELF